MEITKPLGRVEMLTMPYVTENTRVFMLLPILQMDKVFASDFMKQYAQTCSQADPSFLMLVSFIVTTFLDVVYLCLQKALIQLNNTIGELRGFYLSSKHDY